MNVTDFQIKFLSPEGGLADVLARWHQAEWGHLSDRGVEERVKEFDAHYNSGQIPFTLVAFSGQQPIGCASLLEYDLDGVPQYDRLTPWMGSVYVTPEFRRKGVASMLCKMAMDEARRQGVEKLYLFTPDQMALYQRLGWKTVATFSLRGETENLMTCDFSIK